MPVLGMQISGLWVTILLSVTRMFTTRDIIHRNQYMLGLKKLILLLTQSFAALMVLSKINKQLAV